MRFETLTFTTQTLAFTAMAGLCAFALAGCNRQPTEVAPAGASSAVYTDVGPIPGNGKLSLVRPNPYEGNEVAIVEGRHLFGAYNCSGCHGGHGGGGMGPTLRGPTYIFGGSPDHLFSSISEGRADGMPAWGSRIPDDQIWKLVAYIKTMNTPAEPDPPIPQGSQQVPESTVYSPAPAAPQISK